MRREVQPDTLAALNWFLRCRSIGWESKFMMWGMRPWATWEDYARFQKIGPIKYVANLEGPTAECPLTRYPDGMYDYVWTISDNRHESLFVATNLAVLLGAGERHNC